MLLQLQDSHAYTTAKFACLYNCKIRIILQLQMPYKSSWMQELKAELPLSEFSALRLYALLECSAGAAGKYTNP